MMGNKTAHFHKQIILLIKRDKQCVKQVLNKCICTVKWRQWHSELKPKKKMKTIVTYCIVKTVWRRLQGSNKNADQNTVSGWSRHHRGVARNFLEGGSKSWKMSAITVGWRRKFWVVERLEWLISDPLQWGFKYPNLYFLAAELFSLS